MIFYLKGAFLAAVMGNAAADRYNLRNLAGDFAAIAGFSPLTDVRDQNRIDRDAQLIIDLVDAGDFDAAKNVYEKGAYSKVVATLTLSAGLAAELPSGTALIGVAGESTSTSRNSIDDVLVTTAATYPAGTTEIIVRYSSEGCYVGAHPSPELDGCLAATGTLEGDNGLSLSYSYDPLTTGNNYNIKYFTQANEYKFSESDPFPALYQKFVDYYGSETFYDDWIQAGFSGGKTSFTNGNGDFSGYDDEGKIEILEKAIPYGAIGMYVFRELWHALYLCNTGDCAENSCENKPAVHEVDEAVAFWTGSLEGTDGSGPGILSYANAQMRCAQFGTCDSNGIAKANVAAFEMFNALSKNIVDDDCATATNNTDRLIQIATIPLVQGALSYAHITGVQKNSEDGAEAQGAGYAFLVLPIVHACNPADAEIIYNNLKTGQANSASFDAVQAAFAKNYECMGITADDIGTYNGAASSDKNSEDTATGADAGSDDATGATSTTATTNTGTSTNFAGSAKPAMSSAMRFGATVAATITALFVVVFMF